MLYSGLTLVLLTDSKAVSCKGLVIRLRKEAIDVTEKDDFYTISAATCSSRSRFCYPLLYSDPALVCSQGSKAVSCKGLEIRLYEKAIYVPYKW